MPNTNNLLGRTESAAEMIQQFSKGTKSPLEVTETLLEVIAKKESSIHAMQLITPELARAQAKESELRYKNGTQRPLEGVPITIKDTFDVAGCISTRGSRVYLENTALEDSGVVRRLRAAGAVFLGKTNTAEFGQSATSENKLGYTTGNPWCLSKTPGGSSGGAAASVAAGYTPIALGADGGGSIRIPAAMSGVFGFKPSFGLCLDEGGFRGMSDFASAGPLTNTVADARLFLSVLAERDLIKNKGKSKKRKIAYCAAPEGHPVDPAISAAVASAAYLLEKMGHQVEKVELDISGWNEVFGPLVLAEEWRERGHLAKFCNSELTDYEESSLRAARDLTCQQIVDARKKHSEYRLKIAKIFEEYENILTPTVAAPAFNIGERPREIAGQKVSWLWGAFPFTSPFNVAGVPAASIPYGISDALPISVQLVGAMNSDEDLLNLCEDLEEDIKFQKLFEAFCD